MSEGDISAFLDRAGKSVEVSKLLLDKGHIPDSTGISYYAMFYAATAVLLAPGITRRSHKGIIGAFGEFVTNKGLVDKHYHGFFRKAFEARNNADYQPFPAEPEEQAVIMHRRAVEFVAVCRTFLENRE